MALTTAAIALTVGTMVGYGAAAPAATASTNAIGAQASQSAAALAAPAARSGSSSRPRSAGSPGSAGSVASTLANLSAGAGVSAPVLSGRSAAPASASAFSGTASSAGAGVVGSVVPGRMAAPASASAFAGSAASALGGTAARPSGPSGAITVPLPGKPAPALPRFNTSLGWTWTATWKPAGITGIALAAAAPHARLILHLDKSGSAYRLRARDARTGADRWVSTSWQPPQPAPAPGNGDEIAAVPRLVVVTHDGRDYVAVWTPGLHRPGDPGTTADVLEVRLFPADPGADQTGPVPPAHTVVQPLPNGSLNPQAQGTGSAILLTWLTNDGALQSHTGVDAVTGAVSRYPDGSPTEGTTVGAITPDGPVLGRTGHFELPGHWTSEQVAPPNADPRTGTINRTIGAYVIAGWRQPDDPDGTRPRVWSVHDAKTGRITSAMACDWSISDWDDGMPAMSPDGRYVTLGSMAFDTSTGAAHCLSGKGPGTRSGVILVSVGNDGWAFGTVYDPGEETPNASAAVALPVQRPVVRAYYAGIRPPSDVFAALGYFEAAVPRDPDVAVYPRDVSKGGRW